MLSEYFPARLQEAREARGWTQPELGDRIGRSRQAISQFESGQSEPSPEIFLELVRVLEVPSDFFSREPIRTDLNPVFYRRLKSARKRDLAKAERRLGWLQHTVACMERYLEFPNVDIPALQLKSDPRDITNDDIEDAALELRRLWGLGEGSISSTLRLLEHHGCIVVRDALGVPEIDGFSQWQYAANRPIIALSREDEGIFFREQFTVAHELGHLLLHRNVDKRFTVTPGEDHDRLEEQANRFAGAFLLPAPSFRRSLRNVSLDSLYLLKSQWLVSIALMIRRCEDLRLIDRERATSLWKLRVRRGWNRHEPLDDTVPAEAPEMLSQGVDLLRQSKHIENWIREVCLPLADIAQFTSVDAANLRLPSPGPRLRLIE